MPRNHPQKGAALWMDSARGDIEATIAWWQRSGVDFQEVWWALGEQSVCRGWASVRFLMWKIHRQHQRLRRIAEPSTHYRRAA